MRDVISTASTGSASSESGTTSRTLVAIAWPTGVFGPNARKSSTRRKAIKKNGCSAANGSAGRPGLVRRSSALLIVAPRKAA